MKELEQYEQLRFFPKPVARQGIRLPQSIDVLEVVSSIFSWNRPATRIGDGAKSVNGT